MEDDNQIMGMPLIMERNIDDKYVNSVSQAVRDEDKGIETEENETTELNRSRPVRKVLSKNLKDKSHCASSSASMVPGESSTMVSESVSVTETPVTFCSDIAYTKTLLLQDLHESRMCNQLLVPEASEDLWKQGGFLSSGEAAHMYGHSMLGADGI
ncbi:uncharacterized protein LOC143246192 [Tachypleus tridentatus]|uniref:uncharacterized protein LOC143246192 n=1 Tax=Tachypleus tridentatus TaxID=6853 RepID=UPI003FD5D87A